MAKIKDNLLPVYCKKCNILMLYSLPKSKVCCNKCGTWTPNNPKYNQAKK